MYIVQRGIRLDQESKNTKFERMLHYIVHRCGERDNVGTKVLCKLCYFSDFDHYEKNFESITQHNYRRVEHGPIPSGYESSFKNLEESGLVERRTRTYHGRKQYCYQSLVEPDISDFTPEEIVTIDEAIVRYGDMNGADIEEISHKDVPWIVTDDGAIIDYGTVMYRDECTSADKGLNRDGE